MQKRSKHDDNFVVYYAITESLNNYTAKNIVLEPLSLEVDMAL